MRRMILLGLLVGLAVTQLVPSTISSIFEWRRERKISAGLRKNIIEIALRFQDIEAIAELTKWRCNADEDAEEKFFQLLRVRHALENVLYRIRDRKEEQKEDSILENKVSVAVNSSRESFADRTYAHLQNGGSVKCNEWPNGGTNTVSYVWFVMKQTGHPEKYSFQVVREAFLREAKPEIKMLLTRMKEEDYRRELLFTLLRFETEPWNMKLQELGVPKGLYQSLQKEFEKMFRVDPYQDRVKG